MSDLIAEHLAQSGKFRTEASQSLHDSRVEEIAREFEDRGCEVRADHVEGWGKPPTIKKHIPDVYARCGRTEHVVEVETEDTVDRDHAKEQARAFEAWEKEDSDNRKCRIDVAKKKKAGLRRRSYSQ